MGTLTRDIAELSRAAWATLRRRGWWLALALAGVVAVGVLLMPYDDGWLTWITSQGEPVPELALQLTYWGNYQTGSLFLAALLLVIGALARNPRWRRAALASFLAASIGGTGATLTRALLGRPRPIAELPDGLYGPSMRFAMQSLPSGHAATSFGTATALAVAMPVVGVPALIAAAGVGWSRLYLRHHHPTDVLIGASFGGLLGAVLGWAARCTTAASARRRRRG